MKIRLTVQAKTPTSPIVVRPALVSVRSRPLRVLDFDCEARPLHWIAQDYVSKEITAIAWAWLSEPENTTCYLLGETDHPAMLTAFVAAYNEADIVTGHFIRGYDLPLINAMLMEQHMAPLGDKLTHDTKIDLVRRSGISASQENIASMLLLEHDKVKMNQTKWRAANRLTADGLALTRERVVGDVRQHIELRNKLLELNYLAPPKVWRGGTAKSESYKP